MKLTVANFFAWLNHGHRIHARLRGMTEENALRLQGETQVEKDNRLILLVRWFRRVISRKVSV